MANSGRVIHKLDVKDIPKNTVYVGRKSPYWNSFLDSDKYTKNEACAFHRLFLYRDLTKDSSLLNTLQKVMKGKTLLCDCKESDSSDLCHAENYLHILQDKLKYRTYKEPVIHYLMTDLRQSLEKAIENNNKREPDKDWLYIYFAISELKLSISEVFDFCKKKKIDAFTTSKLISLILIDLEASSKNENISTVRHYLNHADWTAVYFFSGFSDRRDEPILSPI